MSDQLQAIDLSAYVETRFFGERPHVRGRRIPIWVIVHTAADNQHGVRELMVDFDLSEAANRLSWITNQFAGSKNI